MMIYGNEPVRGVTHDGEPVMRVMVDNKQVYPNGQYTHSENFPALPPNYSINYLGLLTRAFKDTQSFSLPNFPSVLAENKTIKGIGNYDVLRIYGNQGWSLENPHFVNGQIQEFASSWDAKTITVGDITKIFEALSFKFPTGHYSLHLHTMGYRILESRAGVGSKQPHPFYIYFWDTSKTIDSILNDPEITIPADNNPNNIYRYYFTENTTWLPPTIGTNTVYQPVIAIRRDWQEVLCSFTLSMNISL